jgi:hypothetical protein
LFFLELLFVFIAALSFFAAFFALAEDFFLACLAAPFLLLDFALSLAALIFSLVAYFFIAFLKALF